MTAAEILRTAQAAGVRIATDGRDLLLEAREPPSADLLSALASQKSAVIALLRTAGDSWSTADWLAFFDERAGIAEFEGGLPRVQAETRAFACCVAEWLNRNPVLSPAGRCIGCGGDQGHEPLLPFGTEAAGHAWLHSRCWAIWHHGREAQAAAAIEAMGITRPEKRQ